MKNQSNYTRFISPQYIFYCLKKYISNRKKVFMYGIKAKKKKLRQKIPDRFHLTGYEEKKIIDLSFIRSFCFILFCFIDLLS